MKRTASKPGMIRWRKIGGGFLHIKIDGNAKIIKPNQIFDARLEDIPENFRDVIIPADTTVKEKLDKEKTKGVKKPPIPVAKLEYSIESRGSGYYNVVDKNGKRQNEKALRKEKADALLEQLQG